MLYVAEVKIASKRRLVKKACKPTCRTPASSSQPILLDSEVCWLKQQILSISRLSVNMSFFSFPLNKIVSSEKFSNRIFDYIFFNKKSEVAETLDIALVRVF